MSGPRNFRPSRNRKRHGRPAPEAGRDWCPRKMSASDPRRSLVALERRIRFPDPAVRNRDFL